jgi:hypothetical protein
MRGSGGGASGLTLIGAATEVQRNSGHPLPYVIRVKGATFPGEGTWFITSFFLFMAAVVVQSIVLGRKPSPWGTLLGMLIGWLVVALWFVVVLLV